VPEHGRSPRPRLIDAPAENRATARASAGTSNTDHVESTAALCPGRAPSASTHSTHRAAAAHNRVLGMHARPPRSAAPARDRPTRPADIAIRWTQGGSAPYELSRSHQDWEGSLSLVVDPVLNDELRLPLPHLPGALISVPDWAVSVPACGRLAGPPASRRSCSTPTGERGGAPCPPPPPIPAPSAPDPLRKEIDRQTDPLDLTDPPLLAAGPSCSGPP